MEPEQLVWLQVNFTKQGFKFHLKFLPAAGCAGLGASVALIERHALGGDCLNVGCVPSKALLHAAAIARSVSR